jgi:hypothetical protein
MATAARDEMGKTKMEAVADRGYFSGPEIKVAGDNYLERSKTTIVSG